MIFWKQLQRERRARQFLKVVLCVNAYEIMITRGSAGSVMVGPWPVHTGAKTHFLSRNSLDLMFQKCEFCEK